MRSNLLTLIFLLISVITLFAQPVNDDCAGIIDLGVIPYCPDDEFFTNVDATESDIGSNNFPTGCSGVGDITDVSRDVWFQFTTDATTFDYTITVTGITDGMGSTPLSNPQIAIYRGECLFDELSLLGCGKAADGEMEMAIDIIGLDPNTDYFIRINDWSPTGGDNSGTFKLCVDELDPIYIMGEDTGSFSCMGTLYDSGGEMGDYGLNENFTFTICPNQTFSCLSVDLSFFNIDFFGDNLNFYAGDNTGAPQISSVSGTSSGLFDIEVTSACLTIQFLSDGFSVQEGFELTWACNAAPCAGSSIDNPTVISGIPFDEDGSTTCDEASNFGDSPCLNDAFINGPEYVYEYTPAENICIQVLIENANTVTGVLILDGPADDPGTDCVATSATGSIASTSLEGGVTYYIVVANGTGCTDFDIFIDETECAFSPSLEDALCNPLNGCQNEDGTPSNFVFEDGFQDVQITPGVNDGCWLGVGAQPDFVWFSIEAQADGPFGFILESAGTPSDIDFSVWGPFSGEEVCDTPEEVINLIETTQPIRSSWAAGADPTGLADIHPVTGLPVTDDFDCGVGPGAGGDDFCRTIDAMQGEHYIVLFNDWGNQIEGVVSVDWSPSSPEVLLPQLSNVPGADTTICAGQSIQFDLPDWIETITWVDATNTLSCTDCLDPIATPLQSTTYLAAVEGLCYTDTVPLSVFVYEVDLGPDFSICLGEEVPLSPDQIFDEVEYNWSGQNLSCTDCPTTTVSTPAAGLFEITLEQIAPNCTLTDMIVIEVLSSPAPAFDVSDSLTVCTGSAANLGVPPNDPSNSYVWTSNPPGFNSAEPNPMAFPTENTTYYVEVNNGLCPVSSFDSVFVAVDFYPVVALANDTTVCQGEIVLLANTTEEPGVVYSWSPDTNLDDPNSANPTVTVENTETYTLTATQGECVLTESVTVTSSTISIDIVNDPDFVTICKGETVTLNVDVQPLGSTVNWTTDNGSFSGSGNPISVSPDIITTYIASVEIPGCIRTDTFTIDVDSLPAQLDVMPSDTSVCMGALVVLSTVPPYLPGDFPDIEHQWTPDVALESPDSLFNLVLTATDTIWYVRETTNGVCTSLDSALVLIEPTTTISIDPMDPSLCRGDSVQLMATSPDIMDFTWEPETNISCVECPDPIVWPASTITYIVRGEFEDCPVTDSITIDVTAPPVSNIIDDRPLCLGELIPLSTGPDLNPNTTYTWSSEPSGFFSNEATPSDDPMETTTYTLVLDNGVCPPVTDQVTIEVIGEIDLTVSDDLTICQGETAELSAQGNSSGTYTWQPINATGANQSVSPSETTPYEVTFDNSCEVITGSVTVTVEDAIAIDSILPISGSEFSEGDVIDLTVFTDDNTTGATYLWTEAGQTIGSTASIPFTLINESYNFHITITSENGCLSTGSISISVVPADWTMPNAFTPDGDGINDNFDVITTNESFTITSFQIWNRWGQRVYNNEDPDGWDGTFKDKPQPSDVYIYQVSVIRPSGAEEMDKGELTLLR